MGAGKLSSASYPFIKDVDWTSPVYLSPLPGVTTKEALTAVDKMLVMGASMDGKLLKEAAEAHHKAIAGVDAKGVLTASDYEAVNAALGQLIALHLLRRPWMCTTPSPRSCPLM